MSRYLILYRVPPRVLEARAVWEAALRARRVVMEGFHYRFHPLFAALEQYVVSGQFGVLQRLESQINGARAYDPTSILHAAELGGGALLHNGTYGVHWTRVLFDEEPIGVSAHQTLNPSGADSNTMAELEFSGGRIGRIECSFERSDPVSLILRFDRADVSVTGLIGPQHGHSVRVEPTHGASEVFTIAGRSSFDYQLEEFLRRCDGGGTAFGRGDDIEAHAVVLDAIARANRGGLRATRGTEAAN